MGGRGAYSVTYRDKNKNLKIYGKEYGSEYKTIYSYGNIKYIKQRDEEKSVTAPMESMQDSRIYVTLDKNNEPKFITFIEKHSRKKSIDLKGKAHYIDGEKVKTPHTHYGEIHDEWGSSKLSSQDKELVDKILKLWYSRHRK